MSLIVSVCTRLKSVVKYCDKSIKKTLFVQEVSLEAHHAIAEALSLSVKMKMLCLTYQMGTCPGQQAGKQKSLCHARGADVFMINLP